MSYGPYGMPWQQIGSEQTVYGFTGEPRDENGLLHLRARYLEPAIGVFVSLDPLETANRYSYAHGNPSNWVDPSGSEPCGMRIGELRVYSDGVEIMPCGADSWQTITELSIDIREGDIIRTGPWAEIAAEIHAFSDWITIGPNTQLTVSLSLFPRAASHMPVLQSCASFLSAHFQVDQQDIATLCQGATEAPVDTSSRYPFLKETSRGHQMVRSDSNQRRYAVDYAIRFSTTSGANNSDPRYPFTDNNCTAFASRVAMEAGLPEDEANNWWVNESYDNPETYRLLTCAPASVGGSAKNYIVSGGKGLGDTCGVAWVATPDFENYLLNTNAFAYTELRLIGGLQPITRKGYLPNTLPADMIIFYQGGDVPNHAGVIVGWGPPATGRPDAFGRRRLDLTASAIPWFADNSGAGFMRPINDIGDPADIVRIVHMQY